MTRSILEGQRGGVAILIALSFLLFSIPLITASLDLAQVSNIDARVKNQIVERQYCGLAVEEFLSYLLLDGTRWSTWLSDNEDPSDPSGATSTETVNPCGKNITVTVVQNPTLPSDSTTDPLGNPLLTIPPISSYSNRDFQTSKTVSESNPIGGQSVTYTITVVNRDSTPTTLNQIEDTLPTGFTYDCNGPADQLTLPGAVPVDISPDDGPCPAGTDLEWDMPPGTSISPGEVVSLTFTAETSTTWGTYCNEALVVPGADKTRSGKTAIVQIGPTAGACSDKAVVVTKTVDSATLVSTDTSTNPYTYTFNIDFTIKVDNIGSDALTIAEFIDLLPEGFSYLSVSGDGSITDVPFQLHQVPQVDRQRVTWKFSPDVPLAPVTTETLKFKTTASVAQGNYWSDLLVDFGGGSFSEDRYTWPTALVSVKDVFDVTATDDGETLVISLQVWIANQDGIIDTWSLQ